LKITNLFFVSVSHILSNVFETAILDVSQHMEDYIQTPTTSITLEAAQEIDVLLRFEWSISIF